MDIKNLTRKPINIPLPGGKKLFLGPGKTGQISPKATEHPPIAKLIEDGDVETSGHGSLPGKGGDATGGKVSQGRSHNSGGSMRKFGDG